MPTDTNQPTSNIIYKAFSFAMEKHAGQEDDDGNDYFSAHLMQVGRILSAVTQDEEMIAAGLLHDILEDTDTKLHEIECEFGTRVAQLVFEVTHEGQKDEYGFYFPRLHSRDASLIKFADRLSNLSRMDSWPEARQLHYLKRSRFWKTGEDLK